MDEGEDAPGQARPGQGSQEVVVAEGASKQADKQHHVGSDPDHAPAPSWIDRGHYRKKYFDGVETTQMGTRMRTGTSPHDREGWSMITTDPSKLVAPARVV